MMMSLSLWKLSVTFVYASQQGVVNPESRDLVIWQVPREMIVCHFGGLCQCHIFCRQRTMLKTKQVALMFQERVIVNKF